MVFKAFITPDPAVFDTRQGWVRADTYGEALRLTGLNARLIEMPDKIWPGMISQNVLWD